MIQSRIVRVQAYLMDGLQHPLQSLSSTFVEMLKNPDLPATPSTHADTTAPQRGAVEQESHPKLSVVSGDHRSGVVSQNVLVARHTAQGAGGFGPGSHQAADRMPANMSLPPIPHELRAAAAATPAQHAGNGNDTAFLAKQDAATTRTSAASSTTSSALSVAIAKLAKHIEELRQQSLAAQAQLHPLSRTVA